jgi:hypothetical protein
LTRNRKKEDSTDRSDIKKRSLSALWGGSRKADRELLGRTYLTRLTRDLLVALNLKSSRHVKRMRTGEQRGVGGHAPATFCTRDLAAVSLHLDFPGEHAVLTDGCNGIAGESATVLVVFGGIEGHSAGEWWGTLEREERGISSN